MLIQTVASSKGRKSLSSNVLTRDNQKMFDVSGHDGFKKDYGPALGNGEVHCVKN